MVRCSFCRETMRQGTGTLLIKNDGRLFHFCGSKCEKNLLKLDHVPRTTRWTRAFAIEKRAAKRAHKGLSASEDGKKEEV